LKKFLIDNNDKPKKKIASVIHEKEDRKIGGKMNIYIAVDLLDKSYENLLLSSLDSLSHKYCTPQTMITGFNVTEQSSSVSNKRDCYYQLFNTKRIERSDEVIVIPNKFYIDNFDIATLYNQTEDKGIRDYMDNYDSFKTRPASYLDADIDTVLMERFWISNCISDKRKDMVIPYHTKRAIWKIRKTDPRYRESNNYLVPTYPESVIVDIKEGMARRSAMAKNAEKSECKYSHINSIGTNPQYNSAFLMKT
jgi:hypothetical protein